MRATDHVARPSEVMQLLRRVRLVKLEADPSLRDALKLLHEKMRHITGIQNQEEAILKLLEEKNVEQLSELLSGRGQGRLIMAAASADSLNEWFEALKTACAAPALPGAAAAAATTTTRKDNSVVLKAGSLEKAARGKEGLLRNWRLRYFVLQGDNLSYFTKLGGEKKGSIRVTGGAVRLLPVAEAGGHQFAIELQEGRDLSLIDKELLEEVRKQVNVFRRDQLEDELSKAISVGSEERLSKALDDAQTFGVTLDAELVLQARSVLLRQQHKKLKVDLREALRSLPRRRLQELIRTAKRIRLDPNNGLLKKAILHVDRSDVELQLLRARVQLSLLDDAQFKRALSTVQQFDPKRLTVREKHIMVGILLQWSGYSVLRHLVQAAAPISHSINVLNQVLASVSVYYIETEAMQLARTVAEGLSQFDAKHSLELASEPSPLRPSVSRRPSARGPVMGLSETAAGGAGGASEPGSAFSSGLHAHGVFNIEKYPALRRAGASASGGAASTSSSSSGGRGLFGLFGSKKNLEDKSSGDADQGGGGGAVSMEFTADSINRPLSTVLKTLEPNISEIFEGMQVVLGDRTPAQFNSSRAKARNSLITSNDTFGIADELVTTGVNYQGLRDEMYLQLCKQINKNPKPASRYHGWALFGVYLNCFAPSFGLLPYLRHFANECLAFEHKHAKSGADTGAVKRATVRHRFSIGRADQIEVESSFNIAKQVQYCIKLMNTIDRQTAEGLATTTCFASPKVFSDLLNRAPLEFEVVTMTGSVYRLNLRPFEVDSVLSVFYALFKQMLLGTTPLNPSEYGGYFAASEAAKLMGQGGAASDQSSSSDSFSNGVIDVLLKTFRGFSLYRADGDRPVAEVARDLLAASDEADNAFSSSAAFFDAKSSKATKRTPLSNDLGQYSVEPSEAQRIHWHEDLLWDLLMASLDGGSEDGPSSGRRQSIAMRAFNTGVRKRYILRKHVSLSAERFLDQFDMFEDDASDRDIVTSKRLWTNWLTSGSSAAAASVANNAPTSVAAASAVTPSKRLSFGAGGPSESVSPTALAQMKSPAAPVSSASKSLLPEDHIRIDLLFAEESRYVNARKYVHSTASLAYLMAMQLVMSFYADDIPEFPVAAKHWGSGHDSVLQSVGLSVRPCLQGKMQAADAGSSGQHDSDEFAENSAPAAPAKRTSIFSSPLQTKRISFGVAKDSTVMQETESPFSGALIGVGANSERDLSKAIAESSSQSPKANWSRRLSSGVMFVGDVNTLATLKRSIIPEELTESERKYLLQCCRELGITLDEATEMPALLSWISQFQQVAINVGVSILSPRFRYMMKRAYLGYLAAFPLYGSHFHDALLLGSYTVAAAAVGAVANSGSPTVITSSSDDDHSGTKPVCVAVNGEGLYLIAASAWELMFFAPLFDITAMSVLPPAVQAEENNFDNDEELSAAQLQSTYPMLSITVNGMELQLLSQAATHIRSSVEAFSLEALARGSYPHGTEGGNDIVEMGAAFIPASDQKEIMKAFLHDFPLLPHPPAPAVLPRSADYFTAPKSRRAILAEDHAAEERRELEMSRRAAESHAAKYNKSLESGREALSRIMADDDEEEEEDAAGGGDAADGVASKEHKSRTAKEEIDRQRQTRILSALAGTAMKPSALTIEIMEPQNLKAAPVVPSDYAKHDRGKFHPPALLGEKIRARDKENQQAKENASASKDQGGAGKLGRVSGPMPLNWPTDAVLAKTKQAALVDIDWPSSTQVYQRNQYALDAEINDALQWIGGSNYVLPEYQSRSMLAVAASVASGGAYDFLSEGSASTAVTISAPSAPAPSRRGSSAAFISLNKGKSTSFMDKEDADIGDDVFAEIDEDAEEQMAENRRASFMTLQSFGSEKQQTVSLKVDGVDDNNGEQEPDDV